ncbi:ankyrin repeat-containing domain protein [Dactylonectria estremocensis]|uniref:Ankyrin repeat-containing domain protein n=1 Tax=Dactylonectria estremocensis TaxID=1079267 RepID=A0A9P9EPX8_9HYPO|nr:ankyrin repeat-containing domain protein [Dactylonectria estremocensis]
MNAFFLIGITVERIKDQVFGHRQLAIQVISWITCAKRELTTLELRHGLAVEAGTSEFHEDDLTEIETMVSVCACLIMVDKNTDIIRMVHRTAHDYFERISSAWYPNMESDLAIACINYLSYEVFERGTCEVTGLLTERLRLPPFYEYASHNWGFHSRNSHARQNAVIQFLTENARVEASAEVLLRTRSYASPFKFTQELPKKIAGIHLTALSWAAERNQVVTVKLLCNRKIIEVNSSDKFSRAPLSYAAIHGHQRVVEILVAYESIAWNLRDTHDQTPFAQAAMSGKGPMRNRSPHSYAAEGGHNEMMQLLLATGRVEINSMDNEGTTPLSYAAVSDHDDAVHLLLHHGASARVVDKAGKGIVHTAIPTNNCKLEIVLSLLRSGVLTDLVDNEHMTPMHCTVKFARQDSAELRLQNGTCVDMPVYQYPSRSPSFEDCFILHYVRDSGDRFIRDIHYAGLTPLHLAALIECSGMVQLFLDHGANPKARSMHSETPLHLALSQHLLHLSLDFGKWTDRSMRIENSCQDIDVEDEDERQQLAELIHRFRMDTVMVLARHRDTDANIQDHAGTLAVHHAMNGCYDAAMASELIENGANIMAIDSKISPGLGQCSLNGENEVEDILDVNGFDPFILAVDELDALHASMSGKLFRVP